MHRFHGYHYQQVQELHDGDAERRMAFSRWIIAQNEADDQFLSRILFTDESSFGRGGPWNFHNSHRYAQQNPRLIFRRRYQRRFNLNVWCGVVGNRIVSIF